MTFEVKDEALREAAGKGMDDFIAVIVDAIKKGVRGRRTLCRDYAKANSRPDNALSLYNAS